MKPDPRLFPVQTFIADRQRMLRSWAALQRVLPATVLQDETEATASAMRQLNQLGTVEVPYHEQG